jgi:diguanylate cyclase (GGDEF)-like protein/PAS domain S-box-containing protein
MDKVLRVLMIEDSSDDVLIELHAIKQGGYTVYSERVDTEEQLFQALNNTWDLVLCDYSMPNLGGMKALELVREHDNEVPFIIVSGTIGEEKAVRAIKSGANDYVNKLHLVLLLPAIERIFQEQRIKKENQTTKLALEETKERFFHAFYHAGTGIALVDLDGSFMDINASFCTLLGYTSNELLNMKVNDLIDEGSRKLFEETLRPILSRDSETNQVELRLIHKNAQKLWVILNASLVKQTLSNKAPYLIIHFQDRTEQRYFEEKLLFLTTYNNLTGLLNRNYIFSKINELIQQRKHAPFTLYYIDLDRFKRVNELYDTHIGDILLKKVASQLKERTSPTELLGYLGGNEFILIDVKNINEDEALSYGQSICSALLEPISMQNTEFTLTMSVGICQFPRDGKNINELLKAAGLALRESKRKGGDCASIYEPELYVKSSNDLLIESNLRRALGANEFLMHYQPQFSATTNRPSGMEALIRWKKDGTLIFPDEFIPIAESSSLILKIGEEILDRSCSMFAKLLQKNSACCPTRISVNLSARHFSNPQLIPLLESVLKAHNLSPNHLELEITETALIENIEDVRETLHKIGDLGIQLAIDDFGIGYSSLSYLKDLPINRLKIDKSFIDSCMYDYNSQSIIASIISLAHRIGLEVIAEGVETKEQKQFLEKHHCDEFQGYYFSRPIPPEELEKFLAEYC